MDPIRIGSRREVLWDDFLMAETTAVLRQHKPRDRGVAMVCDAPWEGSGCMYPVVIRDGDTVRLYYKASNFLIGQSTRRGDPLTGPIVACCAESRDGGRTFEKPHYGIYEYGGDRDNNIILMQSEYTRETDNFAVFLDANPDCPGDERFKATADNGPVAPGAHDHVLCWYKSADGVHFTPGGELVRGGWFDSMNCAFWDRHSGQYFLYMRDWHEGYSRSRAEGVGDRMRDIRYSVSRDFKHWSQPQPVDFGVQDDIELYTNGIKPYHRADHMMLGIPTRYVERAGWSPNFDSLPNPEHRKWRCGLQTRYGTAITDCVLITSRDGVHFRRWDEAFMTGGIERTTNWIYGDCYFSWGFVETPSDLPDAPNELSFYGFDNEWQSACELRRYAIRKDGFISCYASLKGAELLTKPLIFEGGRLTVNFATSAAGVIRADLTDAHGHTIPGFEGCPVFGDNLDRPIVFKQGTDVSALSGQPVRLRFRMSEADLYSFKFD